mgnify:CR=1 FL=1
MSILQNLGYLALGGIGIGLLCVALIDGSSKGLYGIYNIGNTCFLNSLLQALGSCKSFRDYIKNLHPKAHSAEDSDAIIVKHLRKVILSLQTATETVDPRSLISSLSLKFPIYGDQHDPHEIFYTILESLSNIQLRAMHSFCPPKQENPLFLVTSSQVVCKSCGYCSLNLATEYDLTLSISRSLSSSLGSVASVDHLSDLVCMNCSIESSLELLESKGIHALASNLKELKVNPYLAEEEDLVIKERREASMLRKVARLPRLLCFHLNRLVNEMGLPVKNNSFLQFPKKLRVGKDILLQKTQEVEYELKAVIEHLGGSSSGHYVTYKLEDSTWLRCSDDKVAKVPLNEVLNAQAYMLFYESSFGQ